MRLLVAGSRGVEDREAMLKAIRSVTTGNRPDLVILGGCPRGVDAMALRWAEKNHYPVDLYPAYWDKFGKAAGPIRNKTMVQEADHVVVVWDGKSRGSANVIKIATELGKPLTVVQVE